jgi:hypothetical protein
MACNPNLGEEWQFSTILALAEVGGSQRSPEEIEEAFFKAKPQVAEGIRSIVIGFWPTFKVLTQASQKKWTYAMYRAYFHGSEFGFGPEEQEVAVAWFAKAVELELRNTIFLPFRQDLSQTSPSASTLQSETESDKRLIKFVTDSNPKMMFGEMYRTLKVASKPSGTGACRELRRWMESRGFRSLLLQQFVSDVEELVRLAGLAKHDSVPNDAARRAHKFSQRILQAIASVAKS